MASRVTDEKTGAKRSRLTLWLILAICVAPVIGSYAAYYYWRPAGQTNYGELLEPRLLSEAALTANDGRPFTLAELKGDWVMVMAAPSACDERCRQNLVYMRQVRLAQGRETGRIERVWLLTDTGAPEVSLIAEHPGLRIARDPRGAVVNALSARDAVHVIDPLGHLMMRFPTDPDPRRMLKDLSRLLRHSKWK